MEDQDLRLQLEILRQQSGIDKQFLAAHIHHETNSLQQHQLQLQKHLQLYLLAQQKEKINLDQFSLFNPSNGLAEANLYKEKKKESAVASTAVKRHLQNFVKGRQKEKMDIENGDVLSREDSLMDDSGFEGSYPSYLREKCNYPLRKTASEPNLKVKARIKKKLSSDHRQSPLLSRHDSKDIKLNLANKIKQKLTSESIAENASFDCSATGSESLSSRIQKQGNHSGREIPNHGDHPLPCDLHASPSLPNIPFGMTNKSVHSLLSIKENRLASRTPSLPGPLMRIPSQQELSLSLSDRETGSLPPSHGPIRAPQLARPHKALNRARSAPTNATSHLQQHLLQKRQVKAMKQMQDQKLKTSYNFPDQVSMTVPVYNDSERSPGNLPFNLSYPGRANNVQPNFNKTKNSSLSRRSPPFSLSEPRPALSSPTSESATSPTSTYEPQVQPGLNPTLAGHRPLHRTISSPATSFMKKLPAYKKYRYTTGIAYSPVMLCHGCACGDDHVEHGGRLKVIWERLVACRLVGYEGDTSSCPCELTDPRKAMLDEMELVHTQEHSLRYGTTSLARKQLNLRNQLIVLSCGGVGVDNGIDGETVWNESHTVNAARMAVGCAVDLALLVAQNQLRNGFALVRPPGHHAQKNLAMAFCYFNSVAITARKLQSSGCARKVLILDWDIHHCNGTQSIFYEDPSVLVISLHRYDDGNFFPGTGSLGEVGFEQGTGFNVNIAFSGGGQSVMGDAEYLSAFRSIVLPIAREFNPDIVLVSAGFSAAAGHSAALGGYAVSPQCFGYLTNLLMELADGKLVLALEGGFELEPLCDSVETCVRALLDGKKYVKLSDQALTSFPNRHAVNCINEAIRIQSKYWSNLTPKHVAISHAEWVSVSRENEACNALASLTVNNKIRTGGEYRVKVELGQAEEPSFPVAMDEDGDCLKIQRPSGEKTPSDASHGSSSPLLDVVGTSSPPTPRPVPTKSDDDSILLTGDDMS